MLSLSSRLTSLFIRFSSEPYIRNRPLLSATRLLKPKTMMTSTTDFPVQNSIIKRLSEALSPIHLAIENESYKHSVPKGSETHFKVIVVSEKFEGIALIEQHRMVNEILAENLSSGVHALAIKTMTPKKWESLYQSNPNSEILQTPNCLGGSKHDKKFNPTS